MSCYWTTSTYEDANAKYIRTATLIHLHKNDKKEFIALCSLLLNNSIKRPKYERSIITHLAKQIRNRYYNPNQIKQTGYNQKQYPNQFSLLIQ